MGPFIYYVRAVYKLCRLKGGGVKNCQYYLVKRRLRGEMGSKLPILGRYSLRTAPKHLFIYVLVRWCISRTEIKYSRIFLWSTFYHGKKWQKYSKKRVFHFFYWKFGFYLCYDILGVVLSNWFFMNLVCIWKVSCTSTRCLSSLHVTVNLHSGLWVVCDELW